MHQPTKAYGISYRLIYQYISKGGQGDQVIQPPISPSTFYNYTKYDI